MLHSPAISSLFALALALALAPSPSRADALFPADVPVECAAICGPMVELTAACEVEPGAFELRLVRRGHTAKPAGRLILGVFGGGDDSTTTTLTAATPAVPLTVTVTTTVVGPPPSLPPLPSPPPLLSAPSPGQQQGGSSQGQNQAGAGGTTTCTITMMISRLTSAGTTTAAPSPPPQPQPPPPPPSRRPPPPLLSLSATPSLVVLNPATSAWAYANAEEVYRKAQEATEKDCVCANESFDVRTVAGLCASCIRQAGDAGSIMNQIVRQCNFTVLDYAPDKDRVADDVVVKAGGGVGSMLAPRGALGAAVVLVVLAAWLF